MRKNEFTDVIPSQITDTPIINMTGSREMTVDGFRGIEDYADNELSFRAGALLVTVTGFDLSIRYVSLHTIVLCGDIRSVVFEKVG